MNSGQKMLLSPLEVIAAKRATFDIHCAPVMINFRENLHAAVFGFPILKCRFRDPLPAAEIGRLRPRSPLLSIAIFALPQRSAWSIKRTRLWLAQDLI
jgi:hypothetical protein